MTLKDTAQSAIAAVKSAFSVTDPNSVESDLRPIDFNQDDPTPSKMEEAVVNLILKRFKDNSEAKRLIEQDWLLCMAFERGNQWVQWKSGKMQDMRDPDDPYRTYITDNEIRPLLNKLKARSTMTKPDASVRPLSDSQNDGLAADEAKDILAHYDGVFDRQGQTLEWVDAALVTSTSFLKVIWNHDKDVLAPDGKGGYSLQDIGDVEEYVVPPFEIYTDPNARAWEDVTWLIHAKVRPLSYIQARYGKRGRLVNGDTLGNRQVEGRMDAITGDYPSQAGSGSSNTATVYEMWELPNDRYPDGRLAHVAGDVLLTYDEWPYDKKDEFPFVPLPYERKFHGLWSPNAVLDLVDLQRKLNTLWSRTIDQATMQKTTIMVRKGSEIGADAYTSPRNLTKIYYEGEAPPQFQVTPPPSEINMRLIEMLKAAMEDKAGVHEVSNGETPTGVTAGNAIELLQQSDTTQMSQFLTAIESAQVKRATWEIELVRQFCKEERLVGMSQDGDPQAALAKVQAFEALRKGGQVRVIVLPGSATPKTPAAIAQQLQDLMRAGAFTPENLPVTATLWKLQGFSRSDQLGDEIQKLAQQAQANNPPPAQLQAQQAQQQAQQAQQQQQMEQQHEAEMLAMQHQDAQFKAQLQGQQAQQAADLAFQHEAQMEAIKNGHALQMLHEQSQSEVDKEKALRALPPAIGPIAVTADPTGVVAIEKDAGITGAVPPPPKPAAPSGGAKK
jgi:hypothetical protein